MNRRLAIPLCLLIGAWSGATLFMWQGAIQSFAVAEDVAALHDPGLRVAIEGIPAESARSAFRFQASEFNRRLFRGWGRIQIPLAIAVLALAWLGRFGRSAAVLSGVMLAIVAGLAAYVVPETIRLGRMIDFAAASALPDVRDRFWTLHHAYTGLDSLKLILGLLVAALAWRESRNRSAVARH